MLSGFYLRIEGSTIHGDIIIRLKYLSIPRLLKAKWLRIALIIDFKGIELMVNSKEAEIQN